MKKLVVYYSYEGNTKYYADLLADQLEADVLELKPVNEKASKGFTKFVWGGYQAVMKKKPDLLPYNFRAADYEMIVFATPVWAGTFAPPLRTFFEREDINGKKVAFLYTHQGGPGKVKQELEEILCDNHLLGSMDIVTSKGAKEENRKRLFNWAKTL